MRNFKKFLSIICSLAIVLGVSIPALTVSAAGFGEAPYAYPTPIIPSGSTTTLNFDNASDYVVANQENALYLSYYNGYGSTTIPSGTTAEITDGKLKFSSGINSGTSIQSWVINKNGAPYELIPGHSYTVTFDFEQVGTTAMVSGSDGPFVSLSAGIANHDWTFKAKYGDSTYNLGAAASVMPTAGNYTYDAKLIANNARDNRDIANTAICTGNKNKVMHGYNGWPSAGSVKTVSYSFVAYYINDSRVKNYLAFTFGLKAGQAFTIDNFKITDNDFVLEVDELSAENDSITYDFANASDYVLDNSGDEPYWSRYYGLPFQAYADDGSRIVFPVEHNLAVSDGALVIKSGVDDIDFSKYSSTKDTVTAYTVGQQRSLTSWIINKNGKPIEIIPGMDYKISVKFKSYETAPAQTFVSVANGVAYDDVNQQYWWSNFGGNASVMAESSGTVYNYTKSNTTPTTATYANNAVFYGRYNAVYANHLIDVLENTATADNTTKTKTFTAYDITEKGAANRKNYLALDFCLSPGQTIEIEEITVTYDYSKVTNVTYDFGDGTTKSVIEDVDAQFSETATKAGYEFAGWMDAAGTVYTTVPKVTGGKLTVSPVFKNSPIVLDDETQNKIVFDFANPDEYIFTNLNGVANKYISYFRPATSGSAANAGLGTGEYTAADLRAGVIAAQNEGKTLQIVEDTDVNEKNVLKLTSGLPNDVGQVSIQSWVLNKNGKPIEIKPGEYYTISVQYREANAPTAKNANGGRPKSFVSISNGIAMDDLNQDYWWTEFGASASVMGDTGNEYAYVTNKEAGTINPDKAGQINALTTAEYPNSAVALWNRNHNAFVWAEADDEYSTEYYTTIQKNILAYDITENGTNANRHNYLALTFAVAGGQEIYIDTITVTKVNKLSFETYGADEVGSRYVAYGTKITLPKADAAEGDQFIAWSNEEQTVSYADVFTMPADNVTLYALYDSAEVTVDPYNDVFESCVNIETDENDNFSVASGSEQAKIAIPNGSGAGNYSVANGGAYKISFNYLLNGNSNAASINAYTVMTGNEDFKETNSYSLEATSSEAWQNGELIVVLNPEYYLADGQYCLANALFLGVNGLDGDATCKFANIVVTALDEPILTVDYNFGDNKVEYKTNAQLDTPEKEGFVFGGWYNSLSQEEFTATVIADDTTVYADWITEYVVADINYDGEVDIRDLIGLKMVAAGTLNDPAVIKRGEINDGYSITQNLVLLRRVLLKSVAISEVQKTVRIAGININNYCVVYENGTNVLLNDAVKSLNTVLGNPVANDNFKIIISSDSNVADGIYVDGTNLVVNSSNDATLISYVNYLVRTITRYEGKYYLGFNANVNYGNSNLNKSEYALVFGDEFDAENLSGSWTTPTETTEGVYKDANGNEVRNYQLGNSDAVVLNNGYAVLTDTAVLKADGTPEYFKYQNIVSDFSFTYGYLEARVKIAESPATTSFWLRGAKTSSVTGSMAEYDMCETFTDDNIIHANIHAFGQKGKHVSLDDWYSEYNNQNGKNPNALNKNYESETAWSADYHVFAVKWDANGISYYLDGYNYFTYTFVDSYLEDVDGIDTFRQPMNILLSTRMGSYNYGPVWAVGDLASANVEIDYVRLYQTELDGGNLNGILK